MSFPLEQRGSPECLPLPLPAPRPANRIVSLGDSSAVAVKPSQVVPISVPSCLCGGRVGLQSQSLDDLVSSMSCLCQCQCQYPPPRWMSVSCRSCVSVSDSDSDSGEGLRSRNCFCSQMQLCVVSSRTWPARHRAQCSRNTVSVKGRKCRHTSCQRVSRVDSVSKPVTPVNVIDFLHRDLRTVCVSRHECRYFVPSAHNFIPYRSRRYGNCDGLIRFSIQRFCSAVLCGLLLLTVLRPQLSMAAPVPSRPLIASEDNHDASLSAPDIHQMLKNIKLEIDLTLGHFNQRIRNQYCKEVLFVDIRSCSPQGIIPGDFKFIAIPKKLGEPVGQDHFNTEEKVDEALRSILYNFQIYPIHLQKLKDNHTHGEESVSQQYDGLKEHIRKLEEEVLNLMKLRGLKPLPSPTFTDSEINNLHADKLTIKAFHWGILLEVVNGVEYFSELMPYLSPSLQSTKL